MNGQIERRNEIIVLFNPAREEVARWKFREAWPMKYWTTDLNAEGNAIVIGTVVLLHEGIELE